MYLLLKGCQVAEFHFLEWWWTTCHISDDWHLTLSSKFGTIFQFLSREGCSTRHPLSILHPVAAILNFRLWRALDAHAADLGCCSLCAGVVARWQLPVNRSQRTQQSCREWREYSRVCSCESFVFVELFWLYAAHRGWFMLTVRVCPLVLGGSCT